MNQTVYVGRQIYRFAARRDLWHGACPFDHVPKCTRGNRRYPIDFEAAARVVNLCQSTFEQPEEQRPVSKVFGAHFLWLLVTGLRRAEGNSLCHSDVDPERRVVTILRHKTSRRHGPKVLHLSDPAMELAKAIKARE